jgi:hypothetical protein
MRLKIMSSASSVKRLSDVGADQTSSVAQISALLGRFGLRVELIAAGLAIPGSYWGEDEAGLIGDTLYARLDTPLHSILHEACHWITCAPAKRANLHTDAADTQEEENATCYLQILLANEVNHFGQASALQDMDAWGYSFRLGSAQAWFSKDAKAEQLWLQHYGLIDTDNAPSFSIRRFE